jgi:hypothetical protein
MERTRSRVKNVEMYQSSNRFFTAAPDTVYAFFVDRETTIDEEHPWYAWKAVRENKRSEGFTTGVEMGGDFTSIKTSAKLLTPESGGLRGWLHQGEYLYNYAGPLIPSVPTPGPLRSDVPVLNPMTMGAIVWSFDQKNANTDMWPSVNETDEELATLGASLVSKLAPTAPHNSVFTSLGELRNDGLPSIPFLSFLKGGKLPEKVGGEYLNYQFGIAPTISDIKSIHETVKKADKLWKQYLRDSGRLVRRRMDMDPETTVETGTLATGSSYIPLNTTSSYWSSVGPITHNTTTTRKRWFSAAYMYYVDESSLAGMDGWLERAHYLYGWKPTPSAAYNLTAWSWLLDWFTNTGDVIDNISLYLEDPFLTRWAYIMEETSVVRDITQQLIDNEGHEHTAAIRYTTSIKKRRKVNPFHMGFKGEALTGHQLAILAALGLTKGRNPGSM